MSDVSLSALPPFVVTPANVVGSLPYVGYGALLHGFMFKADRHRLQTACDAILNVPSRPSALFRVASSYVFCTALYQPRVQSDDPIDRAVGYVAEIDFALWVFTFGGAFDANGMPKDWGFRWLPIWLFVDNGSAIAAGREVFGYPKMLARFEQKTAQSSDPADGRVRVYGQALDKLGPDQCAQERLLLSLQPATAVKSAGTGRVVEFNDVVAGFKATLAQDPDAIGGGLRMDTVTPPMLSLPGVGMPMVFLKQFRDAHEAGRACYQAIVEVDVKTIAVQSAGFFGDSYALTFDRYPSHPFEEVLGVKSGQTPSFSFWLRQDFRVGFGNIVWRP